MATEHEEKILNERANELEKIGFVMQVTHDSVWYEKDGVKVVPTLMMCAPTKQWNEFIEKHKNKTPNEQHQR
jgi:hypothetical protein